MTTRLPTTLESRVASTTTHAVGQVVRRASASFQRIYTDTPIRGELVTFTVDVPVIDAPPAARARAMIAAGEELGRRVIERIGGGRVVMERPPVAAEQGDGVVVLEWRAVIR